MAPCRLILTRAQHERLGMLQFHRVLRVSPTSSPATHATYVRLVALGLATMAAETPHLTRFDIRPDAFRKETRP